MRSSLRRTGRRTGRRSGLLAASVAALLTSALGEANAHAELALSPAGPGPGKWAIGVAGGIVDIRDGRGTTGYVDFLATRNVGRYADFELRATSTGATFVEGGMRVKVVGDVASLGVRFGAVVGAGSGGPFLAVYPGLSLGLGDARTQWIMGVDLLQMLDDSDPRRSSLVLRPFLGVEANVWGGTNLFLHVLTYGRSDKLLFQQGSPAVAAGLTW